MIRALCRFREKSIERVQIREQPEGIGCNNAVVVVRPVNEPPNVDYSILVAIDNEGVRERANHCRSETVGRDDPTSFRTPARRAPPQQTVHGCRSRKARRLDPSEGQAPFRYAPSTAPRPVRSSSNGSARQMPAAESRRDGRSGRLSSTKATGDVNGRHARSSWPRSRIDHNTRRRRSQCFEFGATLLQTIRGLRLGGNVNGWA